MSPKIRPEHLSRFAIIYVRQSTLLQVHEHRQSTERQYNLAALAKRYGWEDVLVQVVDEDLAHSGGSTVDRSGFRRLAAEVGLGRVGAIFSLEVSRFARSSADWHRLLDLCAISDTLIIDDDGVYNPNDFNDRLVLGMKGTMSDAERHLMKLRLQGGRVHKAKKGELAFPPPTGYVFEAGALVFDPDEHVQRAIRLLFERFRIDGSALAVVKYFSQHKLQFPSRHALEEGAAKIQWQPLTHARVLSVLHNPLYTGAYVYGRKQSRRVLVDGAVRNRRENRIPPEQWAVLIRDSHAAYVTWDQYLANLKRLEDNRTTSDMLYQKGAPHRGEALLQGLVICGRCGRRMYTIYPKNKKRPAYQCRANAAEPVCWCVAASAIDGKVGDILLEAFAPSELDLSLAVFREVERQTNEVDRQWKLRIERARYESARAERQYNAVEPENRIVARTLETRWNEKLQDLRQIENDYEDARRRKNLVLTQKDKEAIFSLAKDLPKVWRAPTTTNADRKRILRLVVQDVVLLPVDVPERTATIRLLWKTGAVTETSVPQPTWSRKTTPEIVELVRGLAARKLADIEIAEALNQQGLKSGRRKCAFTKQAITMLRRTYEIPAGRSRGGHLPLPNRDELGRYSVRGLAERYRVTDHVVRYWAETGVITAERDTRFAPIWFTITPEVEARIQKAKRNGYGPRTASTNKKSATKDSKAQAKKGR